MKNILRCLVAIVFLIIAIPFLTILMIMIRIESQGNPIFKQRRVGKGGRVFTIYKLRTMRLGDEPLHINSPFEMELFEKYRITRLGTFLRKYHIDEVPQLVNILKGDMVFVGHRPNSVRVAGAKSYYAPRDENMTPGLSGFEQVSSVSGKRGYNCAKLDRFYCQKKSFLVDLFIIFLTSKYLFRKIHDRAN